MDRGTLGITAHLDRNPLGSKPTRIKAHSDRSPFGPLGSQPTWITAHSDHSPFGSQPTCIAAHSDRSPLQRSPLGSQPTSIATHSDRSPLGSLEITAHSDRSPFRSQPTCIPVRTHSNCSPLGPQPTWIAAHLDRSPFGSPPIWIAAHLDHAVEREHQHAEPISTLRPSARQTHHHSAAISRKKMRGAGHGLDSVANLAGATVDNRPSVLNSNLQLN